MKKINLLIIFVVLALTNVFAQPTLVSPADLSVDESLTPTFDWGAVVGAGNYNFQLSDDNTFATTLLDLPLGNVLTYTVITPLTPNTTYYWRVMDDFSGLYSSFYIFTTYALPDDITLVSPSDNSYNAPLSVNFSWNAAANTDTYDFELATDLAFTNIIDSQTGLIGTSATFGLLSNYTQYFWRVKGVNAFGSGNYTVFNFTTVLADPVLVSPTTLSYHNPTNIDLVWNTVQGAASYDVELAEDLLFTVGVQTFNGVLDTTVNVPGLANFTDYFFRVKAVNVHGTSNFSGYNQFKTKLAAPVLVAPLNNSINNSIVPLFDWNSVVGGAPVTYTLQAAEDALFTLGLQTITNLSTDEFQFSVPGFVLNNDTQYYYRVSATDIYGTSDYSSVYTFRTVPRITPVLGWPIGGAGAFTNPQLFSWFLNQFAPGTIYDFELSLNNDLTTPVITVQNINATTLSQSLNGLPGNTKLYWRVTSKISPTIVSYYSAIDSFTIQTPGFVALVPYLSHPIGATTIYNTSATLYWYLLAAGSGLTYDIEINTTGVFTGVPTYTGAANLYYNVTGLTPGATYFWQVRSYNGSQYSDWSTPGSFVVNGSSTPALPVPSWPTGGNIVYSTSPTLYWYLNEYAVGLTYELEFNNTNTFTGIPTVTGLTSLYHTLPGLTTGETYYWKVRSYNGTNYSAWSLAESFEVYGQITALIPVPSNPIGGTTVYTTAPTLSWYLNGSGVGLTYDVEFNSTGVFTGTPTYANISALNYNLTGLTAGLTYYWKVRSYNGTNYSSWSNMESFVVVGSGGSLVPVLSWPIGGATVYSTSQTLLWYLNGSSVGLTYQVEVSTTGIFTGVPTYVGLANTSYLLSGLTEGSSVYWRVRSYNGVSPSSWSASEYFVVYNSSAPLMPITGSPAGGVIINTNSPTISWILPAQNNSLTYQLEISDNPAMENSLQLTDLNNSFVNVNNLNNNSNYYWRVRSKSEGGTYSSYSNIASFSTIDNVTNVEDISIVPDNYYMSQNYPNPFNPTTNIKFGLPNAGNVKIVIYNMLGQEIKTLINQTLNAGTYNLMWNGENEFGIKVTSGAYLYRISTNNFTDTKKLLLIK